MKVLFFAQAFPIVSETFVLNQVTAMIDRGHDVRVYGWGKPDECIHEDFIKYNLASVTWGMVHPVPHSHIKRALKALPYLAMSVFRHGPKALRLLSPAYGRNATGLLLLNIARRFSKEQWKPDVIISHFGDNGILINAIRRSGIIDRRTICYTFFHAHEICRLTTSALSDKYRPMLDSDDRLLPISRFWYDKLRTAGADTTKMQVFRMGIDPKRFTYRVPQPDTSTVKILTVGRLVGQKGYEYAIHGIAGYIKKTNLKVSYTIIGQGPLDATLKRLVRDLGIADNVTFLGPQTQDTVRRHILDTDIFLLPSVTDDEGYMEGIPVALMEAMAMGPICISTYHSGIPELIEDGISGFLCNEKDSGAITDLLIKAENLDCTQRQRISQNAHDKIIAEYNVDTLMDNLSDMISNDAAKLLDTNV